KRIMTTDKSQNLLNDISMLNIYHEMTDINNEEVKINEFIKK
ncbi:hypothetical protein EAG_04052, partial [Camponotus floridanus]